MLFFTTIAEKLISNKRITHPLSRILAELLIAEKITHRAYENRGQAYFITKKYEEAIKDFREVETAYWKSPIRNFFDG